MRKRLMLGAHDLAGWRARCHSTHAARFARLVDQAESYLDSSPPPEHPTSSITYIGFAAANLSLTYLLTGETRFLDGARRWIAGALAYPHWGKARMPDHDLDAAWLLFGLSLTYDWLAEALPADECAALRDKLILHGRRLYAFSRESLGRWWGSAYWQNHNWICYTGLAAAGYALADDLPEGYVWAEAARENFNTVFASLAEDGSDYEGVVYWRYGVLWLLIYADLVQQVEGIDFHNTPFLQNTFFYRLYLSAPDLVQTANFGDCHDRRSAHSAAILYRLAALYGIGQAQELAERFYDTGEWARERSEGLVKPGVGPEAWLEILWYEPSVPRAPIDHLALSRAFPDAGLFSARTDWTPDASVLVFKSGTPSGRKAWTLGHTINAERAWDTLKASHAHPDENSFIWMRGGDYLTVDEGYSQHKLSQHHSTILVDGRGQYHEGKYNAFEGCDASWGGHLVAWSAEGGGDRLIASAHGEAARAYDPSFGVQQCARHVILLGPNLLLIRDNIESDLPHRFAWLLQTDVPAEQLDARRFRVPGHGGSMTITVCSPERFTAQIMAQEITANPTSAQPDWIIRRTQHTLKVETEYLTRVHFLIVLSHSADRPAG